MGFTIEELLKNQNDQPFSMNPMRPADMPQESSPIDPIVKDYLMKKQAAAPDVNTVPLSSQTTLGPNQPQPSDYDLFNKKFSGDNYKKALADSEDQKSGLGWSQFAAGLGDALAGRDPSNTAKNFQSIRQGIDDRTVGQFEKQKAAAVQDIATKRGLEGGDPNSAKSKVVQNTISKLWGDKFTPEQISKVTADDADLIYKPMELKSKLEEQHDNNLMKREMMSQGRQDRNDKKSEADLMKIQALAEQSRGSPAVGQAEKDLYASSKVKTLLNMYSDPNQMNDKMVNLLVQDVAKIASGSQPSQHELEGMQPNTWTGKMASAWQSVSNNPTPANAAAFIKQYADYSSALAKDAQKVIEDKYGRVFDPYSEKYKDNQVYQAMRNKYVDRFKNESSGGGKITVSNGKETLMIDPSDLPHALKDGFQERR